MARIADTESTYEVRGYEVTGRTGQVGTGFGSSGLLGSIGDAVGGVVSTVGDAGAFVGDAVGDALDNQIVQTVLAPLVVPTAIVVKGATAALGATGLEPLEKLDQAVGEVYRGDVIGGMRDNFQTQLEVGAAVGGGILAGQSIAGALGGALEPAAADSGALDATEPDAGALADQTPQAASSSELGVPLLLGAGALLLLAAAAG